MWKYIETKDSKGKPLEPEKARAAAAEHFGIKDRACPIVITKTPGVVAVWCAGPRGTIAEYPPMNHPPTDGEGAYEVIKG